MADYIKRQDAIDAIENINRTDNWKAAVILTIMDLPSAQPDKDMIHLQKEQAYLQGWEDGRAALSGILT